MSSAYANTPEAINLAAGAGEITVQYAQARFRCDQKVEAYEMRPQPAQVRVLVQPVSVGPACDCLYNVSMRLENVPPGSTTVSVFRRSDTQPTPLLIGEKVVEVP